MKCRLFLLATLGAALAVAQGPEQLQNFRLEYRLEFDEQSSAVLGTELGPAVFAGSREIRQQVVLDAPAKRLTVRTFSVPGGAPAVTPLADAQAAEIENYRVDVKRTAIGARDFLFEGTVAPDPQVFLAPVIEGDTWRMRAAWYGPAAPVFNQILIDFPSRSAYIPGAAGLFEYSAQPNRAPVAVIAEAPSSVFQPEVRLDASQSSDPDGEPISLSWRSTRGSVSISGAGTATPRVQFKSGPGRYDIVLTVTDARGASSEASVSVSYYGR